MKKHIYLWLCQSTANTHLLFVLSCILEPGYSNLLLQLSVGSLGLECEYTGSALDTFQCVVGGILALTFLFNRANDKRKKQFAAIVAQQLISTLRKTEEIVSLNSSNSWLMTPLECHR